MSKKQNADNGATRETKNFYLVLHGEIAIFDSKKENSNLFIYTPEIPEHVYMAGPWLGEQRIPRGLTLKLTGIDTPGTYQFMPDSFLILRGGTPNPALSYMKLIVPRPNLITACKCVDVKPGSVTFLGPDGVSLVPPGLKIARCIVFTYVIQRSARPELEALAGPNLTTKPHWCAGEDQAGWCSLHVYAEGDAPETLDHAASSFNLAVQVLGTDAILKPDQIPANIPPDRAPDDLANTDEIKYTLPGRIAWKRGAAERNDEYTCGSIVMTP